MEIREFCILSNTIDHMMKRFLIISCLLAGMLASLPANSQDFKIIPEGYFQNKGVDVMAFYDFYPEGHQGGVCVIRSRRKGLLPMPSVLPWRVIGTIWPKL